MLFPHQLSAKSKMTMKMMTTPISLTAMSSNRLSLCWSQDETIAWRSRAECAWLSRWHSRNVKKLLTGPGTTLLSLDLISVHSACVYGAAGLMSPFLSLLFFRFFLFWFIPFHLFSSNLAKSYPIPPSIASLHTFLPSRNNEISIRVWFDLFRKEI